MKRIFKYPIPLYDYFSIWLPGGGKVLSVDVVANRPFIWAIIDDAEANIERKFRLVGTGHPLNDADEKDFVGTFQLSSGILIFHLFVDRVK